MKEKTVYYSDLANDDFAGVKIDRKPLPENYEYFDRGFFRKLRRFFVYFCIVRPITFLYNKLVKRVSYVNKKALKGYKKRGCFMYGNHTCMILDAFDPTYIAFPRPADTVINADAMSIKGISGILKSLGGLPIPRGFHAMKTFNDAITESIRRRHWVAIYPEAHIWHYYTGIRPFTAVSFSYPVKLDAPSFSFTMVYKKRKFSKYPKRKVYIDGPFFADKNLSNKEAAQKLRDEVYSAMCSRAALSDREYIKYVYRPKEDKDDEVHRA